MKNCFLRFVHHNIFLRTHHTFWERPMKEAQKFYYIFLQKHIWQTALGIYIQYFESFIHLFSFLIKHHAYSLLWLCLGVPHHVLFFHRQDKYRTGQLFEVQICVNSNPPLSTSNKSHVGKQLQLSDLSVVRANHQTTTLKLCTAIVLTFPAGY